MDSDEFWRNSKSSKTSWRYNERHGEPMHRGRRGSSMYEDQISNRDEFTENRRSPNRRYYSDENTYFYDPEMRGSVARDNNDPTLDSYIPGGNPKNRNDCQVDTGYRDFGNYPTKIRTFSMNRRGKGSSMYESHDIISNRGEFTETRRSPNRRYNSDENTHFYDPEMRGSVARDNNDPTRDSFIDPGLRPERRNRNYQTDVTDEDTAREHVKDRSSIGIDPMGNRVDEEYYRRWIYSGEDPRGVFMDVNHPKYWKTRDGKLPNDREIILNELLPSRDRHSY